MVEKELNISVGEVIRLQLSESLHLQGLARWQRQFFVGTVLHESKFTLLARMQPFRLVLQCSMLSRRKNSDARD